ncbi:hypothetical protein FB451DRAFT_1178268 [Mycena latifolia]|nr:hypothetical protein FB451DRAFT_1178268 [Mycena latifolia]
MPRRPEYEHGRLLDNGNAESIVSRSWITANTQKKWLHFFERVATYARRDWFILPFPVQLLSTRGEEVVEEFIGFHGTGTVAGVFPFVEAPFLADARQKTTDFWDAQGAIIKPPEVAENNEENCVLGNARSSADAELGDGLYVADAIGTAKIFAQNNAKNNPGTVGKICAIYAKDSKNWKAFNKDRRSLLQGAILDARSKRIGLYGAPGPRFTSENTFLFSAWASGREDGPGQVLFPEPLNPYFTARCFDSNLVGDDEIVRDGVLPAGAFLPDPNFSSETSRLEHQPRGRGLPAVYQPYQLRIKTMAVSFNDPQL